MVREKLINSRRVFSLERYSNFILERSPRRPGVRPLLDEEVATTTSHKHRRVHPEEDVSKGRLRMKDTSILSEIPPRRCGGWARDARGSWFPLLCCASCRMNERLLQHRELFFPGFIFSLSSPSEIARGRASASR